MSSGEETGTRNSKDGCQLYTKKLGMIKIIIGSDEYKEVEMPPIIFEVSVLKSKDFLIEMLEFFKGKGAVFISSDTIKIPENRFEQYQCYMQISTRVFFFDKKYKKKGYILSDELTDYLRNEIVVKRSSPIFPVNSFIKGHKFS